MTRMRIPSVLTLFVATAALAVVPAFAAKGGKAQVINWRMTPTMANLNAEGKIQYKAMSGKERFNLTVHDLAVGAYTLNINGSPVATFQVGNDRGGKSTTGMLRLKGKKGNLPFNPLGGNLTVSGSGVDFLTASLPDCEDQANDETHLEADLVATGAIVGATGGAEYDSDGGETQFEVRVSNLPAGSYDLVVGGTVVGTIVVNDTGFGKLEFSTEVEDQNEDGVCDHNPLLTFDPLGQLIQVSQAGTSILEVTFPAAPPPVVCPPDDENNDDQGENEGGDQ